MYLIFWHPSHKYNIKENISDALWYMYLFKWRQGYSHFRASHFNQESQDCATSSSHNHWKVRNSAIRVVLSEHYVVGGTKADLQDPGHSLPSAHFTMFTKDVRNERTTTLRRRLNPGKLKSIHESGITFAHTCTCNKNSILASKS